MGLFNSKINIGEGKKYDVSQVSTEGISAEERAELEKKNRKLIDVFKAFDQDGDGSLSKLELAAAMDAFSKMDTDKSDNKLSKKELEAGAEGLNAFFKSQGKDVDMDADGLKAFMKAVRKLTKNDEKVSTSEALDEIRMLNQQEQERIDAANKAEQERQAQEAEKLRQAQEAEKLKQEQEAQEAARLKDLQTPKNYTVQLNDRLDDILKKSLEAQGIEVTDETMAEAKAEFIKNNPKALHGPKGKEYLYAGDVIKIPGNLEDKANADEVKSTYTQIIEKRRIEKENNEKNNSQLVLDKALADLGIEKENVSVTEASLENGEKVIVVKPKDLKSGTPTESKIITLENGQKVMIVSIAENKGSDAPDKPEIKQPNTKQVRVNNEYGNELYTKNYDANGKLISRTKSLSSGKNAYFPINNNSTRSQDVMVAERFAKEFDSSVFSVAYINGIANAYGEEAAKEFIEAYDEQAKKHGKKTIKEQLVLTGSTFIDSGRLKRLGLSKSS